MTRSSTMPSVTVVIPNWNGIDLIRDCLRALGKQTYPHHTIVVDNGSVDGSNKVVASEFPHVELLQFSDNAGFAGGVNRGIKPAMAAQATYIALLNNDAVAEPTWLEHLVEAAEANPQTGMVAAKIIGQDGKHLDSTGDFYSIWGFAFPRGRGEIDIGQYDDAAHRNIFAASGGASLYRADMLRQIGLFDERFFAYFEDVDISFRAQLAGWHIVYEPQAVVRHFIGGTSSRMDSYGKTPKTTSAPDIAPDGHARPSAFARYHTVKNFAYVYTKNMPGWLYLKYFPRFVASEGMMFISDCKRGLIRSNLKAHAVALAHLPGLIRDRMYIQRRRTVSIGVINGRFVHQLPPLQRLRFERLGLLKKGSK